MVFRNNGVVVLFGAKVTVKADPLNERLPANKPFGKAPGPPGRLVSVTSIMIVAPLNVTPVGDPVTLVMMLPRLRKLVGPFTVCVVTSL